MLFREIYKVLGTYLYILAGALLVPLGVALYYQFVVPPELHPQPHSTGAFVLSLLICLGMATGLRYLGRGAEGVLYRREGLAIVVFIWFVTAFVAALPYYLSGTLHNPLDAYFEAISGLTTTGASVMTAKAFEAGTGREIPLNTSIPSLYNAAYEYWGNIEPVRDPLTKQVKIEGIEAVGKGLLFWRSFTQWLGGMGIVVLFVAVLPALGIGGKMLYQAEVPGPTKDAVTPRIKHTASWLWRIYLAFTVAEVALLLWVNPSLPVFDAVTITFSTLATGGFSCRNAGIGAYHHPGMEWVIIVFMLIGSINFAVYYHCTKGKFFRIVEPEFVIYLLSLLFGCLVVVSNLVGKQVPLVGGGTLDLSLTDALRTGVFHLVSAQTSTGFSFSDYDKWPYMTQVLMLVTMFVGSMSGSTGGGIKVVRHYMVFRIVQHRVESIFRPETVRVFRIGNKGVDQGVAQTVLCFYLIVIALSVISTLLYSADGIDPETSLGLTACMANNIGMSFRAAGPTYSFAFLPPFSKLLSIFLMVAGRLEFFAVMVLLIPAFWKNR